MNVLITSVARKVWLVEAFRRAAAKTSGRVWATDSDDLAVGLRIADGRIALPRMDHPDFESLLTAACGEHLIRVIVPTRDAELPWFADRREQFGEKGVTVMVAEPGVIHLCQDKRAFLDHCMTQGFRVPRTLREPSEATDFPLFVRPRVGAGGRAARRLDDATSLSALTPWHEWIVQAFVDEPEYTIDLFADFEGRVLSAVPRRRLRVVAGESVVSVTVREPHVVERAVDLATSLGLVGHNTLQCFFAGEEPSWIEVNPRYGGGAALSFAAGADTPEMLLQLIGGTDLSPRLGAYQASLCMYRYSTDLFVQESQP